MNITYLNTLPEVENKFNIKLQDGEKVIFTAKPTCFGTETGRLLGSSNSKITLTNKRIIADNNVGVWTVDIAEDIVDYTKVESGAFIFKSTYILVNLNKEIIFNNEVYNRYVTVRKMKNEKYQKYDKMFLTTKTFYWRYFS